MPLYVLLLFILFYQVFILHRVSFICDCTYEYVCNVSSPATEAEKKKINLSIPYCLGCFAGFSVFRDMTIRPLHMH